MLNICLYIKCQVDFLTFVNINYLMCLPVLLPNSHISHIMRKPVYAIGKQRRERSTCASSQSDQCLVGCFHQKYLPKSVASIWYYPVCVPRHAKASLIYSMPSAGMKQRLFLVYTELSIMRIGGAGFEQFSNGISFRVADAIFPQRMYIFSATGRCLLNGELWWKTEICNNALFLCKYSAHTLSY